MDTHKQGLRPGSTVFPQVENSRSGQAKQPSEGELEMAKYTITIVVDDTYDQVGDKFTLENEVRNVWPILAKTLELETVSIDTSAKRG